MRSTSLLLCASVAALLLPARPASACTTPAAPTVVFDESRAALDVSPPTAPGAVSAQLIRRLGTDCSSGQCISSSCGDYGLLSLSFSIAIDDQDDANRIGYILGSADGPLPAGLETPQPLLAPAGTLRFDVAFDDAPTVAFRGQLMAVDSAGNVSDPSEPFEVAFNGCTLPPIGDTCVDESDDSEGCALSAAPSANSHGGAPRALLALLACCSSILVRRRFRR